MRWRPTGAGDGRGEATHRAGEHTRKRAKDAECNAWNAGDAAGGVRCRWVRDGVPMTANPPNSVAESASRAIDPDAQARRPARSINEGEASDDYQSIAEEGLRRGQRGASFY